jgi:ribosomal protein L7/L12
MSLEQDVITLRRRVAELENRIDFLYRKLNIAFVEESGLIDPRIVELLRKGNKIEAIKIYREINDVGLAEAKQAMEEYEARLGL